NQDLLPVLGPAGEVLARGAVRCRLAGDGAVAQFGFGIAFAFLDPRSGDDMLVVGHIEQAHARRAAADHAQVAQRHADHLGLVGDQHQLVSLARREARHHRPVAADIVDIGDALAAAASASIFIGRAQLAIAVRADSEDE
ncbi:hypothetical protein QU38_01085, partial [Staphylococcus aureus]